VSYPLFQSLAHILVVATGLAAATGIIQSFIGNILHEPQWFDLGLLSSIVSGGVRWWTPAIEGGVVRASGIYQEPSFVSAYVGIAGGLALVRCGVTGARLGVLKPVVPLWAALSIILGLLLTFSSVCYASFFCTYLGAILSRMRLRFRSVVIFFTFSVFALAVLFAVALQAGPGILGRFVSLSIFSQLGEFDPTELDSTDVNFSVMVLFLNAQVALHNFVLNPLLGVGLGAHGAAYAQLLPNLSDIGDQAVGLNSNDAAALSLRLISETGIIGCILFTAIIASAWLRARRAILRVEQQTATPQTTSFVALAAGLNGALLGVFVAYLGHIPHYYDPQFWALFAMCVAIPRVAQQIRSSGPP
jgi:hypothetical protein